MFVWNKKIKPNEDQFDASKQNTTLVSSPDETNEFELPTLNQSRAESTAKIEGQGQSFSGRIDYTKPHNPDWLNFKEMMLKTFAWLACMGLLIWFFNFMSKASNFDDLENWIYAGIVALLIWIYGPRYLTTLKGWKRGSFDYEFTAEKVVINNQSFDRTQNQVYFEMQQHKWADREQDMNATSHKRRDRSYMSRNMYKETFTLYINCNGRNYIADILFRDRAEEVYGQLNAMLHNSSADGVLNL